MGFWKRATGRETPQPRIELNVSRTDFDDDPGRELLVAQYQLRGSNVWRVEVGALIGPATIKAVKKRTANSIEGAFIWATEIAQVISNRSGKPVVLAHQTPGTESTTRLAVAARSGDLGEAGYAAYGTGPDDYPRNPGFVMVHPNQQTEADA